ncbi:ComF family protein [Virgibacillus soli]|uniref:ComF family protein n=1 Tax=Paracerasibacillus soli TaxID=480284 RepID=A0ABU5CRC0_9BACI|nr:ComF family protein [Virgibacillus soli]MDY0408922.1 ComF family protein [Virgibacillus soli]
MTCLWCFNENTHTISWTTMFVVRTSVTLCTNCEQMLQKIRDERCRKCCKWTTKAVCADCKWWEQMEDPLTYNHSVFTYNHFMQAVITKWKYRGDYMLGEMFRHAFYKEFQDQFKCSQQTPAIVPIPLSDGRLAERKFNQAAQLAQFLTKDYEQLLMRTDSEKQAKKTRRQRIFTKNPFKLVKPIHKPVVLVDDIYTTGTTLRHAASILKQHGCPSVYGYTLVRG